MGRVSRILTGFFAEDDGKSGLIEKSDGTVWYRKPDGSEAEIGSGGSQPAVLMHSKTLSTAELLALDTVAVECLPAPGGRFYYDVQHVVWHYRYGGTPFAGSFTDAALGFYPAGVPLPAYNPSAAPTLITPPQISKIGFDPFAQTEDVYVYAPKPDAGNDGSGWLASAIEDKPLSIGLVNLSSYPDPLVPWTDGNGSLTVRIFYALINGAP